MEKELDQKRIIITLISFIIFWSIITDAWGYSDFIFENASYDTGKYVYGYISRFVWVTPAVLLIRKYNNQLKINKKELFSLPKGNRSLLLVVTISIIYTMIGMLINHKGFWFNSELNLWLVCIKYMIVGFVEETAFRGWGYNSLANMMSHRKATIITTILFMILHYPAYLIKFLRFGVFDLTGIITQSISTLVWGFVFCWLLKKGKTIWNPIIAHTIYDLVCVLLLGGN